MPVANGAACQYLNDCEPGSSCWGPARVPPSRWTAAEFLCRRSCILGEDGADAGELIDGDDGGVSAGGSCGSGSECVAFDDSGLDLSTVNADLGQCE
jgi:hypothetical protein